MSKIKYKKIALLSVKITGLIKSWQLPTFPLLRSIIGVTRLNFSVRNGKRWNPCAIITCFFILKQILNKFFNQFCNDLLQKEFECLLSNAL